MKQSWTCEFCGESYFAPILCLHHESDCTYNPKNRTCDTCKAWYWDAELQTPKCKIPEFKPFNRQCDAWITTVRKSTAAAPISVSGFRFDALKIKEEERIYDS